MSVFIKRMGGTVRFVVSTHLKKQRGGKRKERGSEGEEREGREKQKKKWNTTQTARQEVLVKLACHASAGE